MYILGRSDHDTTLWFHLSVKKNCKIVVNTAFFEVGGSDFVSVKGC